MNSLSAMTRAQLNDFDPNPMYGGVDELRYLCPSDVCRDKPADNTHRSLTVRTSDSVGQCFRCAMKGKLRDSAHAVPAMQRAQKPTLKDLMS